MMASRRKAVSEKKSRERPPQAPGNDVAVAAWLGVIGFLVGRFPGYADFSGWSADVLTVLSYVLYGLSIATALIGVSKLFKSKFLENLGLFALFAILAYVAHVVSTAYDVDWYRISVRAVATCLIAFAIAAFLIGIPHLFVKPASTDIGPSSLGDTFPPTEKRSTIEYVVAIIVALISLATAVFQFLDR